MGSARNRKSKDRARRAKLRARLEAAGVDPDTIEQIIATKREDDRARRLAAAAAPSPTRDQILANTDNSLWPDDTGYRPSKPDPLLHGAARASGVTAKVARRRETITRFQYERLTKGTE